MRFRCAMCDKPIKIPFVCQECTDKYSKYTIWKMNITKNGGLYA